MDRRALLAALLAVAAIAVVPVGTVAAQNATATDTPDASRSERIDQNTRLVSAEYNADTGEAVITLESDSLQDVVITDAGDFMAGGVVDQRTVQFRPDERATIRMPVTKHEGYVGISITTRTGTLYAVPMKARGTGTNPFSQVAPTLAWLGGAGTVMTMTGYAAVRTRRSDPDEPEPME